MKEFSFFLCVFLAFVPLCFCVSVPFLSLLKHWKVNLWAVTAAMIALMISCPRPGYGAIKDRLVDPYYTRSPGKFTLRMLYGGVNSSNAYKSLKDVRGGGIELEYEKMTVSGFFSGVIGLGYLSFDDSSATKMQYLKSPFLKAGFNYLAFSFPGFIDFKIGPDIQFAQVGMTDKNGTAQSFMGVGLGVNLSVDISMTPKWFLGGGLREGLLNFGNEEVNIRYFFFHIQRSF